MDTVNVTGARWKKWNYLALGFSVFVSLAMTFFVGSFFLVIGCYNGCSKLTTLDALSFSVGLLPFLGLNVILLYSCVTYRKKGRITSLQKKAVYILTGLGASLGIAFSVFDIGDAVIYLLLLTLPMLMILVSFGFVADKFDDNPKIVKL